MAWIRLSAAHTGMGTELGHAGSTRPPKTECEGQRRQVAAISSNHEGSGVPSSSVNTTISPRVAWRRPWFKALHLPGVGSRSTESGKRRANSRRTAGVSSVLALSTTTKLTDRLPVRTRHMASSVSRRIEARLKVGIKTVRSVMDITSVPTLGQLRLLWQPYLCSRRPESMNPPHRKPLAAHRQAPDFLFENVGSHGDVMPLIAIAAELVRRGHRCQLLANEHFRAEAAARGIGFFANTAARTHGEIQAEIQSKHLVPYFFLKTGSIREYFEQPGAFDERTVMVHTNAYGGSDPLAEAHRLRTVELVLFPVRIRSAIAPPWPLGAWANGPDGEQFLRMLPTLYDSADRHPVLLEKINSVRVPLG